MRVCTIPHILVIVSSKGQKGDEWLILKTEGRKIYKSHSAKVKFENEIFGLKNRLLYLKKP